MATSRLPQRKGTQPVSRVWSWGKPSELLNSCAIDLWERSCICSPWYGKRALMGVYESSAEEEDYLGPKNTALRG
jgi:hypothetical protein